MMRDVLKRLVPYLEKKDGISIPGIPALSVSTATQGRLTHSLSGEGDVREILHEKVKCAPRASRCSMISAHDLRIKGLCDGIINASYDRRR